MERAAQLPLSAAARARGESRRRSFHEHGAGGAESHLGMGADHAGWIALGLQSGAGPRGVGAKP